jgi:hypothetical protein
LRKVLKKAAEALGRMCVNEAVLANAGYWISHPDEYGEIHRLHLKTIVKRGV